MTSAAQLDGDTFGEYALPTGISWWDPDAECTLVMSQPALDRELWLDYLDGAARSYRKYGAEKALDLEAVKPGWDTSVFFAAVDRDGCVIGGLRATRPLRSADESHAVVEWAGQPGESAVRKMITDRLPFGVVEMKSAWADGDRDRSPLLADVLARTAYPTMTVLNVQFLMATAASHVLGRWRSSGGVVASRIPATPYPDDRYRTKMMWWDRSNFINYATPEQAAKMVAEMSSLSALLDAHRDVAAAAGTQ
ncbi:hypothetical protein [Mycolicibacterium thermoresistibile]|jgi:hypothetical protein|uniref:Uncharacterized protein n=2 Tax=Mycolicibacterium thermoresistibile TaxID=1797 RepID=G7CLC4_MYCT3|nr:hypothetical protein [Mycolicibacterium thermoresistibile]EHI11200.1 hypothetical protein KEK_19079 [Mycolicibacterium thermoresistibile ATCC 19527]GAT16408.1 putative uncharacterized protein [Mycolicibacterium thermoresistibile]SNW17599.1 Uncharacterised protein [Mycolicibacterium thermoresistibile]